MPQKSLRELAKEYQQFRAIRRLRDQLIARKYPIEISSKELKKLNNSWKPGVK